MTWLPKVTVPERTGRPPVLWKASVTFSHQRRSAGSRTGSPVTSRAGGVGAGLVGALAEGVGVSGAPDATGPGLELPDGRPPSVPAASVPASGAPASVAVDEPGP